MPFQFLDFDYTAQMEAQLDQIAQGVQRHTDLLTPAYQQLLSDIPSIRIERSAVIRQKEEQQVACPQCSAALKRISKKGKPSSKFWVHVDRKAASDCVQFFPDARGRPVLIRTAHCPKCGQGIKRLASKKKKGNYFWVHIQKTDADKCQQFLSDAECKGGSG